MALAQRSFLAFLVVGPHQAWLTAGLSWAPSAPSELSWLQIPGGNFPEGRQHRSGQHPLAVPDHRPPREVPVPSGKPSLGRTELPVGKTPRWEKPATATARGQRQGLGSARRVAAAGQGVQGR